MVENDFGGDAVRRQSRGLRNTEYNHAAGQAVPLQQRSADIFDPDICPAGSLAQTLPPLPYRTVAHGGQEGAATATAALALTGRAKNIATMHPEQIVLFTCQYSGRLLVGVSNVAASVQAHKAFSGRLQNQRLAPVHLLNRQLVDVALRHVTRVQDDFVTF